MREQIAGFEVEHVQGPEEIPYKKDELVVLCLVRDGEPWARSFIEHYFSLGAKHIVFLDNDSTDDTVSVASEYDNVTLLRTKLPFSASVEGTEGQNLMRRYLIERFGRNRWSLCVDIDESFDYPYSDIIALDSLLGYLNSNSYTAVTAQMLDMFPERLSVNSAEEIGRELKKEYRFYNVSEIDRSKPKKDKRSNIIESDEIAIAVKGGIRANVFGFKPLLTKYPLLFYDGTVEHMGVHSIRNARVADLTCVLFHYKFYAFALQDYWYKAIEHKKKGIRPLMKRRYEQYVEVLEKNPELQLKQESSRAIASVNDLLENGFLVSSEDYISWVNAEEEKNLWQADPQSQPDGLAEPFLESRRQERAKTLMMGRLEQQLLEHRRQEQIKEQRIKKLKQQKRKQSRDISELEKRILDQGQKIQRLRRKRQRLRKQNDRLKQELANVAASRTWRLVEGLHRIKAKAQDVRTR